MLSKNRHKFTLRLSKISTLDGNRPLTFAPQHTGLGFIEQEMGDANRIFSWDLCWKEIEPREGQL